MLTGGTVIIGHVLPADPNQCLIFSDALQNSAAIDLYTGATVGFTRHYPPAFFRPAYDVVGLSPDKQHLAYSGSGGSLPRQLFVKATDRVGVNRSILVQSVLGAVDYSKDSQPRDFAWSPDGRWLAYWWQLPDGQAALGVADANGHVVRTQAIAPAAPPAAQSKVYFHGWSADSHYLAVSVLAVSSGQYTLSLWTAPILTRVRDIPYTRLRSEAITPLSDPDQLALWSTRGHQLAYLSATADAQGLQFGTASPEHDSVLTILPIVPMVLNNGELPTLSWSPDDQHLTMIRVSPVRHWLDVIDLVTQTVQTITDQAMQMESLDRHMYIHWTSNSQSLLYAQKAASTANPGNIDIMYFDLANNQSTTLIADVYDNAIADANGQYLIYKQSIWRGNLETIDGVILNLGTRGLVRVSDLDSTLAATPVTVFGESSNGWLAIGEPRLEPFVFGGPRGFDTKIVNLDSGSVYHQLNVTPPTLAAYSLLGDDFYPFYQFLSPDGSRSAVLENDNMKLVLASIKEISLQAYVIYKQPVLFETLKWSANSQQVAMLYFTKFTNNQAAEASLALTGVTSDQIRRIEPLPWHDYQLTYATCR